MSEQTERALRLNIERAIYEAGFTEARVQFLREGLKRLGPHALRELLSIIRDLSDRLRNGDPRTTQGGFW